MYTARDQKAIQAQSKRRLLCAAAPAAILLALIVWSFVARVQWATVALTIVLGCGALFFDGLLLAPLRAYGRFLQNALHGRTHETRGRFLHLESQSVLREGVAFYPLTITVGDGADRKDDRLFYFDAQKPLPAFTPGEPLVLTSHDNQITAFERPRDD